MTAVRLFGLALAAATAVTPVAQACQPARPLKKSGSGMKGVRPLFKAGPERGLTPYLSSASSSACIRGSNAWPSGFAIRLVSSYGSASRS